MAQRLSSDERAQIEAMSAETVYAACYDHTGRRGLPEGSWRLLPRRCRRRRPRGHQTRKPGPLGDFRPIACRPAAVEDRREARRAQRVVQGRLREHGPDAG